MLAEDLHVRNGGGITWHQVQRNAAERGGQRAIHSRRLGVDGLGTC